MNKVSGALNKRMPYIRNENRWTRNTTRITHEKRILGQSDRCDTEPQIKRGRIKKEHQFQKEDRKEAPTGGVIPKTKARLPGGSFERVHGKIKKTRHNAHGREKGHTSGVWVGILSNQKHGGGKGRKQKDNQQSRLVGNKIV